MSLRLPIHGRNHLPGGSDPIPGALARKYATLFQSATVQVTTPWNYAALVPLGSISTNDTAFFVKNASFDMIDVKKDVYVAAIGYLKISGTGGHALPTTLECALTTNHLGGSYYSATHRNVLLPAGAVETNLTAGGQGYWFGFHEPELFVLGGDSVGFWLQVTTAAANWNFSAGFFQLNGYAA